MVKVLIIDDDTDMRSLLSIFLSRLDCEVEQASDGDDGEGKALEIRPALVLLDVMLGRQDGYTTCANLRSKGFTGYILMVTAVPSKDGKEKALQCGANAYMEKPINLPALRLHLECAQRNLTVQSDSSISDE